MADWDETAPTGLKSYKLNNAGQPFDIVYAGNIFRGIDYLVSYWIKNNGTAYLNGHIGKKLLDKNGWSLYEHVLSSAGIESVVISGNGTIDELRIYPAKSLMKTFCYSPEVGVISTADANNAYIRYEYDGYNRLYQIKDWDRNILKKIEYIYQVSFTPCANISPNWQPTGNTRCAKNNLINNANTGLSEREEKDINTCSPTYLQTRWVIYGASSGCPIQICTGQGKRWVNGICESGSKIVTMSNYLGNLTWECTFHYLWSDGFTSPEYTVSGTSSCSNLIPAQY